MFEAAGAARWLQDGMTVDVLLHEGAAISAEIPTTLTVTVADTPSDRMSEAGSRKAALVNTGATVQVPGFVQNGERIVVNTVTGDFVRRAAT